MEVEEEERLEQTEMKCTAIGAIYVALGNAACLTVSGTQIPYVLGD